MGKREDSSSYPVTPASVLLVGAPLLASLLAFLLFELVPLALLLPLASAALTIPFWRDLKAVEAALESFRTGLPLPVLPDRTPAPLRRTLELLRSLVALGSNPAELQEHWQRRFGELAVREERNRLARDLHGSVHRQLLSIDRESAMAEEHWQSDPAGARGALERAFGSTREAMVEMQALLLQLQPEAVAVWGLFEALREQCDALAYRSGLRVSLVLGEPAPEASLPPRAQEELFRIALAVFARAERSQARWVRVELGRHRLVLALRIEYGGGSFDPMQDSSEAERELRRRVERIPGRLKFRGHLGRAKVAVAIPLLYRSFPWLSRRMELLRSLLPSRLKPFFWWIGTCGPPVILLWIARQSFGKDEPLSAGISAGVCLVLLILLVLGSRCIQDDLGRIEASLESLLAGRPLPTLFAPLAAGYPTPKTPLGPCLELLSSIAADGTDLEGLRAVWRQRIGEAAAQEERNRLARDLHDSVKQQLFSIQLGGATARERWDSDPAGARAAIMRVRKSAHRATVEMQALLQQLRPAALAEMGLVEALREQCEALSYRTEAEVELSAEPAAYESLEVKVQEEVFRIAQEALANVARHARARHVRVDLSYRDDRLILHIRDDGQGFARKETKSRGMGLRNLRHRAASLDARLDIAGRPGEGTTVNLEVPLG